jgi:hypothetical protein
LSERVVVRPRHEAPERPPDGGGESQEKHHSRAACQPVREKNVVPALILLLGIKFLLGRRVLFCRRQPTCCTPHGCCQCSVRQPGSRRKVLRRKRLALFLFDHGLLLCRVLASDDVTETHPAALVDLERRSLFSLACTPPEGREGATAARLSYGGITARGAVGGAYQPGTVLANVGIGPCLFRPRRTRAESAPPAGRAVLLPLHPSRSGVDTLQRGPCVVDPAASWDPLRHERRRGAA